MIQTRRSPIIVGERYELVETLGHGGENGDSGLLVKSEYPKALLSMSGYDKYAGCDVTGYGIRKPSQTYATLADYSSGRAAADGSYYTYAQSGLTGSQAQAPSTPFDRIDQLNYGLYQPRATYDAAQSVYGECGVRKVPEVRSYSPGRGNKGTHVYVYLRSEYDLLAEPAVIASVMFASHQASASLTRLESQGHHFEFVATCCAPNFSETSSSSTQVQLQLQLEEQSGQNAGLIDIGHFQYVASILSSFPQEGSKKRKLSMDSPESMTQSSEYSIALSPNYAYPRSLHSTEPDSQRRYTPLERAQNRFRDVTSRRGTQDFSPESSAVRTLMRPPSSTLYSPPYSVFSSKESSSNPPLIRTSTMQQSPGAPPSGPLAGSFNAYPMYGQKAVLKLKGNLNSMTENWTPEEWAAKRRLVQFSRSRDNCIVNASFAPVKPEDRQPNSICISCIWWEERQECFATSVDTISLLEQLVDNRFTVEEKNRIRRNLEGFKPLTVCKGKPDSEEFFKLIMRFPNPKPRNIEKDVKVFEWKILAGALKKILSKYSASLSSTAGPLHTSRNSIYNGYASDPSTDHYARVSSRSASNSTSSSAYAPPTTLKSNTTGLSPDETISSHFSEAPGSASLSISSQGQAYVSPSLASNPYSHETTASPPIGHLPSSYPTNHIPTPTLSSTSTVVYTTPSLERSRSDYSNHHQRHPKRPRANTSSATAGLYEHDHTASAYQQASRSFSEQPDHRVSLPSLSEEYAVSGTEQEGVFLKDEPLLPANLGPGFEY